MLFLLNYPIQTNNMDQINEMIECPKLYLINYFDTIRAKIDIEFYQKIQGIQDVKLKEETTKKWIRLIELTEECLKKCLINKIPNDIINKTKKTISKYESSGIIFNREILEIKSELENYLLSNDSYLAVLITQIFNNFFGYSKMKDDIHKPNLPNRLDKR